ncbi:zinc finger protein 37A-like [Ambystoma mexicanum]|uniref:zinc finger protein 37A-like n=1 Tax=Ambystoma mexicanum TaxID=8296 RepID=UPI0037E95B25
MSMKESEEDAFQDESAYFSEEEWELLQEWQKELYRKVMKEIHQALISLGPLITTTVCSLRAKEKEEPFPMHNEYSKAVHRINNSTGQRITTTVCSLRAKQKEKPLPMHNDYAKPVHRLNHSTGDITANLDVKFKVKHDKDLQTRKHMKSEEREINDCLSPGGAYLNTSTCLRNEDPRPCFIDHLGEEMTEPSRNHTSEYEVVSFRIKDEEGTCDMDHQENKRMEGISSLSGDETRKHKARSSIKHVAKATPTSMPAGSTKVKIVPSFEKAVPLWTDLFQEPEREEGPECETGSDPDTFFPETLEVQRSETYGDCANLQETLYSCVQCEKTFSKKEYLYRHRRTHMGVRPHQCPDCNKSFRRRDTLLVHKRTHTGERPYWCAICDKSFNQVGALNRHHRTHLGDRPYQCHLCEKSFSQNGTLIAHQKTHNNPKYT